MVAKQSSFNESAVKQLLRSVVQEELSPVKNEMQLVKEEMQQIRKDMREYRDEVATMKDEIVGELQTAREESTIHTGQHDRFDEVEQRGLFVKSCVISSSRVSRQRENELTTRYELGIATR